MATPVLLADAIEDILDAIVAAVNAATGVGQPLEGVVAVVRGDRARPQPQMPAIWVVPEPATSDSSTLGAAEAWTMPVRVAALVNSDDPEQGGRDCVRLTALARREVLRDRRLGLAYVQDTTSTRFDAAVRRSERNRNLHWADATITVRFKVWEAGA